MFLMNKFIEAFEARTHWGQLLDEVRKGEFYHVIERKGKPVAALLSMEEFEEYLELVAKRANQKIEAELRQSQREYQLGKVGSINDLKAAFKPLPTS